MGAAWRMGSVPSRFLIPLAFAANVGGLLTLVSTPPNIIVTDTLSNAGLRPFDFFEFGLIGLPLLGLTILFMIFVGRRLVPERQAGEPPLDLQITGGAELMASGLVQTLGGLPPLALLAGIFLLTSAFTQVISNTAATVLMAPVVLRVALSLDLSPHPLLMALTVAAATGYLTPISSTTNLMVMTPGGYRFGDYMKVGLPLLVIIFVASLALIPFLWSL
jgi:di/tricarboxylate transporter